MWRFSDAELNCVSTNIRLRPACRQLLMGISINRYFAPIGTAGFERMCVSGKSRVPRPPPRINVRTSFIGRFYCGDAGRVLAAGGSVDESIAETHHRLDLVAGGAELGAQPADVDVDRPRLDEAVVAPDTFEQPIARQHPVLVLDEKAEQFEFPPRQLHRLTVDRHRHG